MRYGFIGCTHLGDGGPGDDFGPEHGPQARALRRLLRRWICEGVCGVALGDIADLWQADAGEVQAAHPLTLAMLRRAIRRYFVGNHDRKATWNLLHVDPEPYGVIKDKSGRPRIWCEHGDRHDWLVARHPMLCERVTRIVGRLERGIHKDVDEWAMRAWYWLSRTGRHGENEAYWGPVATAADEHECRRAVFAHTHEAGQEMPLIEDGSVYVPVHAHNVDCWIKAWNRLSRAWTWRQDSVELVV